MTVNKSILAYDIKDLSFSDHDTKDYYLIIYLSESSISLLVFNPNINKYLALKSYEISGFRFLKKNEQLAANIEELSPIYKKRILVMANPFFTIVPSEYFSDEMSEYYYKLNYDLKPDDNIRNDFIKNLNSYLIYTLDIDFELIDRYFAPTKIIHAATPYLASILSNIENYLSNKIFTEVEKKFVRLAILKDGKLLLYNSFQYKTKEDLLYILINTSNQLGFDTDRDKYYFSGRIEKETDLYKLLFKYIRYPLFLPRFNKFFYPSSFDTIPSQLFYNAFTVPLCE